MTTVDILSRIVEPTSLIARLALASLAPGPLQFSASFDGHRRGLFGWVSRVNAV